MTTIARTSAIHATQRIEEEDLAKRRMAKRIQQERRQNHKLHERRLHENLEHAKHLHPEEKVTMLTEFTEHFNNLTYANAWEKDYMVAAAPHNNLNEKINLNKAMTQKLASRHLAGEEIKTLIKCYLKNSGTFLDELEDLAEQVMDGAEGSETKLINAFLSKSSMSKGHIYLALSYLLHRNTQHGTKPFLERKLQEWLHDYEAQESGYLFEFFSLVNNDQIQKEVAAIDVDYLARLNSQDLVTGSIIDCIKQVNELFHGKFTNIVSLYMKLRAQQLQLVGANNLTEENKSQFYELVKFEKYLMLINSLNTKQNDLINNLIRLNLIENPQEYAVHTSQALIATCELCETKIISSNSITRLLSSWQCKAASLDKQGQLLNHLIQFISGLPTALFKNDDSIRGNLIEKLRKIMQKNALATNTSTEQAGELSIFKAPPQLVKYI